MARRNPYGVHYIPTHQRKAHYDHMRDSAPGLVKLVSSNGAPDVQQMADCYAAAPNAIHVYRNHPLSEQHDDLWSNPVGTAVRHASTWQHELRIRRDEAKRRKLTLPPMEQTSVLGINEPVIELFPRQEDGSNYDEWLAMVRQRAHLLDLYMSTFVWECVKYGQPCHVGNFSGGQPANLRPGEYATYDWFPKTRAAMEATRGMSALAVHEYWDVPGPGENPDWWTYRFFHCDWAIDTIDVLETGVDRAIRSHQYEGTRGYAGHMNGQAYVRQLATYMLGCLRDSRFRCATPFTMDGDKMWESFWIDPILGEMTALSREMQQAVASHNPPNVGGNSPSVPGAGHKAYLPHVPVGSQPSGPTAVVSVPAGANVRQEPSTAARILGAVPAATPLPVTGKLADGSWLEVQSEWGTGWVSETVVTPHNTDSVPVREVSTGQPSQPQPQPQPTDTWTRSYAFVSRWEGGYQAVENDAGNWTGGAVGKGQLKGTKYGISAASYPHLDIKNLTREQATEIYRRDYWQASGADKLPWPACLVVFDTAVLHGVGTAQAWQREVGINALAFAAKRLRVYTKMGNWDFWGKAWVNRVADLLEEASRG